jgi:hypothetical protein
MLIGIGLVTILATGVVAVATGSSPVETPRLTRAAVERVATGTPTVTYGYLPAGWTKISANPQGDRLVEVLSPMSMRERDATGVWRAPTVAVTVRPAEPLPAALYSGSAMSQRRSYAVWPTYTDELGRLVTSLTWDVAGRNVIVAGTDVAQDRLVAIADGISVG